MRPGRSPWAALVGAACCVSPAVAQTARAAGSVDVGVSTVRYDGFLPSGAASVTPAVRREWPGGSFSARGTYLRFQSGNVSLQGIVAASLLTPPAHHWRGELLASAGASQYRDFAGFWHAIGQARLHLMGVRRGAWLGGTTGQASYGDGPRAVTVLAAGAWARRSTLTLIASAARAFVGDTAYTDIESTARARRGALELEGTIGSRLWSRGGGRGVYGEASATLALGARLALIVAGGRYPTDPLRGSIAARYLTIAMRFHTPAVAQLAVRDTPRRADADGASSGVTALEVQPRGEGVVRLVVRAPGASAVDIAGDFTDWQPVALAPAAGGGWEAMFRIPAGIHRICIRIDGGGWIAPAGVTRAADDFGGDIGIFVVP